MAEDKLIQIIGLNKTYIDNVSTRALVNIHMSMDEKEFVSILGSSGCGKSTLLNSVSSLERPDDGEIKFRDEVVTNFVDEEAADYRRSSVGIICKDDFLIPEMTVEENISLPMVLDEGNHKVIKRRLERVTKFLGIYSIIKRKINDITEIESKKVSIARALIHNPDIIVMDEPTGNLRSEESLEILKYLKTINDNFETAIMIATDSPYSSSFADRVIFMKDGMIIDELKRSGSQQEFYSKLVKKFAEVEGGVLDDDKLSHS